MKLNPTVWVLVGVAVVLIGYDVFAAIDPLDNFPTITTVMQRMPALVIFLLGVVTGHLFWPTKK